MDAKEKILDVAKQLGLSMTSEFVPWSRSRNSGEPNPSLNWKVALMRLPSIEPIIVTDYSAGMAHAPGYKRAQKSRLQIDRDVVDYECEHGVKARYVSGTACDVAGTREKIEPDFVDVLYSLSMDSDVIDRSSFEEWADDFGYDTDSRKAEKIYRECLDIALKLRNAIGEGGLRQLREACQDY